ncbi:MAG: hypothetical protein CBC29_10095 [Methylococcaceae bacterium TMED69]|nr:MAG: hypothetical protein CBC29_10095 [Methylococcaceae bacterium TMED69]
MNKFFLTVIFIVTSFPLFSSSPISIMKYIEQNDITQPRQMASVFQRCSGYFAASYKFLPEDDPKLGKVKQQSIQLGETAAVLSQFLLEKESSVAIQDLRNINVEQIKFYSDHYLQMLQSAESKSGSPLSSETSETLTSCVRFVRYGSQKLLSGDSENTGE